ncbi:MAG: DUF4167 domain-containing protein [Sphingopyxis sp.]
MSINNRQQNNGRRRGRSNNSGGPRQSGGQNRNYDQGNRIDSRARGNATQLLEKYRNMARDAQLSGDRVMTEYYLQFADHYFRVLSDARVRQEEQRGRGDERDEAIGAENDGDDQIEELDAIDMIGRAPRNRDDRGQRDRGPRDDGREPRGEGRNDGRNRARGEYRTEQARDDYNQPSDSAESPAEVERADESVNTRRQRPLHRERVQRDSEQRENGFAIDAAVLPPAIGIEQNRETASTSSDDQAIVAPKRTRRTVRKTAEESPA